MRRVLPVLVMATAACALPANDTKAGALDNGQFSYNCIDSTDPACPDAGRLSGQPFPAAVALGGRFTLSFEPWQPRDAPNFTVQAVSSDFFANDGSGFQALRVGTPWLVVLSQIGAVDMASLSVRPVSTVQLIDTTSSSAVAGRTHVFRATALGSLSEPLAGSVAYRWTTSDANVLSIQNAGGGARCRALQLCCSGRGRRHLPRPLRPPRGRSLSPSLTRGRRERAVAASLHAARPCGGVREQPLQLHPGECSGR